MRDLANQFPALQSALDDLLDIARHLSSLDLHYKAVIRPLLLVNPHLHASEQGAPIFQTCFQSRKLQTVAQGGRYDTLVSSLASPDRPCRTHSVGVSIALAHLISLVANPSSDIHTPPLHKEIHSSRRCDVYIVSFVAGAESERLRLAALLWKNGIKADLASCLSHFHSFHAILITL